MTARRISSVVIGTNADLIAAFAQLYIQPDDVGLASLRGEHDEWVRRPTRRADEKAAAATAAEMLADTSRNEED